MASLSGSQVTVNLPEQGRQAGGQAAVVGEALAVPAVCSGGPGGKFPSSGSQGVGLERVQDSRTLQMLTSFSLANLLLGGDSREMLRHMLTVSLQHCV